MKQKISELVKSYVNEYSCNNKVISQWKEPIIKFANAKDLDFKKLKSSINESHLLPEDLLPNAKTVIAYFIPFNESIANSNEKGKNSSKLWSIAYIETNELISNLNQAIKKILESQGYESTLVPATHNFDEKTLMSNWSHRHIGEIAGLGTFGLNNMLITASGCCGRIGSLVTSIQLKSSEKKRDQGCLYKFNNSCGICVDSCQFNALTYDKFDREKCYEICLMNDRYHSDLEVTDVCGKCCVNLPCSFHDPVYIIKNNREVK